MGRLALTPKPQSRRKALEIRYSEGLSVPWSGDQRMGADESSTTEISGSLREKGPGARDRGLPRLGATGGKLP